MLKPKILEKREIKRNWFYKNAII